MHNSASTATPLRQAIAAAVRPWLESAVARRGVAADPEVSELIEAVAAEVETSIAELVDADPDVPLSGPLERIRRTVVPVNEFLQRRDVPKPMRNTMDVEMHPEDLYDLGPMTFRDLGDEVHDAGITWGAAKAHLHLKRHR